MKREFERAKKAVESLFWDTCYVEIFTEEHSILLKKYEKSCVICGGREELVSVKAKKICRDCLEEIKSIVG